MTHAAPPGQQVPSGDISVREWICWENETPSEPTSTMVLTAPSSTFVDVRLLRPAQPWDEAPLPNKGGPASRLEWAFSGVGESSIGKDGVPHKRWLHVIDSKCAWGVQPLSDEGDMVAQEGAPDLTLEMGAMVRPETGVVTPYKELWRSVQPMPCGNDPLRRCVVLALSAPERKTRGIIVRVGQFCQALLMEDALVDIERWEYAYFNGGGGGGPGGGSVYAGKWQRTAKLGSKLLPCHVAFEEAGAYWLDVGSTIEHENSVWKVEEACAW